jgi:hypothetical protein
VTRSHLPVYSSLVVALLLTSAQAYGKPRGLTPEERGVVRASIEQIKLYRQDSLTPLLVASELTRYRMNAADINRHASISGSACPQLTSALLAAHSTLPERSGRVGSIPGVRILTHGQVESLRSRPGDFWDNLQRQYGAQSILSVSRPVFDLRRTLALVYTETYRKGLGSIGSFILLSRRGRTWREVCYVEAWTA